jgi:prepilin-type N-terminal cleavage/methylation domain-containing protein
MMPAARGYSLIEFLIALALFGFVAAAIGQMIVVTQRARQVSENWMRATQLAADRIEAVRAGVAVDGHPYEGIFQRETTLAGVAGHPGLKRLDVTVSWTDTEPHRFTLSTLVRE